MLIKSVVKQSVVHHSSRLSALNSTTAVTRLVPLTNSRSSFHTAQKHSCKDNVMWQLSTPHHLKNRSTNLD